jgi:hypothetical protein
VTIARQGRRTPIRRGLLSIGVVGIIVMSAWAGIPAVAAEPTSTLGGQAVGALGDAERLGDEAAAGRIEIQLALKLRNFVALKQRVQQISTPGSPEYGRAVSDAEFRSLYAPASGDVERAKQFLASHGLSVTSVNGTLVDARGTVGQVQAAMKTHLGRYRDRATGRSFFANDSAPSVPSSLAPRLVGIHGLSTETVRRHPRASIANPNVGGGPAGGYTPNEIKAAYNLQSAPLTGLTGTGQTVGILELDAFRQESIDRYDTQYYGAPITAPAVVLIDGATNTNPGSGQLEAELDIEVVHAIAPAAPIRVYVAPNTTMGLNDAYTAMATDSTLKVASTSWGACENLQGASENNTLDQIFVQAAARSVSFFAASGDSGAYDCRGDPSVTMADPLYNTLSSDSPASDPYVTGVGGTSLTLVANAYGSETAWSEPSHNPPRGTGGGLSIVFPQPTWQVGAGVANGFSNGKRQVPDVAHVGAPSTGYSVNTCVTGSGASCSPGWVVVGGTSAGAPAWAAYAALYDQYAANQAKPALGYANPTLYGASRCPLTFAPYHDITSGDNLSYPATTGWDFPTGLGSFKAGDLTSAIANQASAPLALQSLQPGTGATTGSTTVTLSGCGFTNATTATFGGTNATVVSRLSSTQLQVTAPAHAPGTVQVSVTNPPASTSSTVAFTYVAPPQIVAAVGRDNAVWINRSQGGWTSLGGIAVAAPAVVSQPGTGGGVPLIIITGNDHDLWMRTQASAWQRLDSSAGAYCIDNPAAVIVGSNLTVACQGADHHLYTNSGPLNADLNLPPPQFSLGNWVSKGGILITGPALAVVPVTGMDIMVLGQDNLVYEYYASSFHATAFRCTYHPAIATKPDATASYFGCRASDRTLTTSINTGSGWSQAASMGGQVVDGPGIATDNQGPTFFVQGVDSAVYERGLLGGYLGDGGVVKFGVGASILP